MGSIWELSLQNVALTVAVGALILTVVQINGFRRTCEELKLALQRCLGTPPVAACTQCKPRTGDLETSRQAFIEHLPESVSRSSGANARNRSNDKRDHRGRQDTSLTHRRDHLQRIDRVSIARGVVVRAARAIRAHLRKHPGTECEIILCGTDTPTGIHIESAFAPQVASFSCSHVTIDRGDAQARLDALRRLDPRQGQVGGAHLQPGGLSLPSAGDRRTDAANARLSRTGRLITAIVTEARDRCPRPDTIRTLGLRFHFYMIGEETNFTYRRLRPVVTDSPGLWLYEPMLAWMQQDPERTELDLASLRALDVYALRPRRHFPISGPEQAVLELTHRRLGYRIWIILDPKDPKRRSVWITDGVQQAVQFAAMPATSRLVWMTPLVLAAHRAIEAEGAAFLKSRASARVLSSKSESSRVPKTMRYGECR